MKITSIKIRPIFIVFGILIILGSLGVEFLPSTSSGIGPLQIIGCIVGLLIIALASLQGKFWLKIIMGFASFIVTLFILEIALIVSGAQPNHYRNMTTHAEIVNNRTCDSTIGCRFNTTYWDEYCLSLEADEQSTNRNCHLNSLGFSDTDEFVESSQLETADYKVLMLGDSFTWGASADAGQAWVETIEDQLEVNENVLIWNGATPATGTKQAIANAQQYMPILEPDLVVLGFYIGNDFMDNLSLLDHYSSVMTDDGNTFIVFRYKLDANLQPVQLSTEEIKYNAFSAHYPQNQLENALGFTRVGTLILHAMVNFQKSSERSEQVQQLSYSETQRLILELNDYVTENGARFIVLVIPTEADIESPTEDYLIIRDILKNANIMFVDPLEYLVLEDYVASPADDHWNNDGHAKAGELMLECITSIMNENESECPQIE